jgi:MtfA peptidase
VIAGLADPRDGHATATHEFAHVASVMDGHFQKLRQGRRAERQVMDDYGGVTEAEFFAVATESFFEKPRQLREKTPDLYEELRRFYGWDPARAPP